MPNPWGHNCHPAPEPGDHDREMWGGQSCRQPSFPGSFSARPNLPSLLRATVSPRQICAGGIDEDLDLAVVAAFAGFADTDRLDPGVIQLEILHKVIADDHGAGLGQDLLLFGISLHPGVGS